ncbi:MAG: metallophosphoesterase [Methylobacterium radiotolerans]
MSVAASTVYRMPTPATVAAVVADCGWHAAQERWGHRLTRAALGELERRGRRPGRGGGIRIRRAPGEPLYCTVDKRWDPERGLTVETASDLLGVPDAGVPRQDALMRQIHTTETLAKAVLDAGGYRAAAKALGMAPSSVRERLSGIVGTVQGKGSEDPFATLRGWAAERGLLGFDPVLPGYAIKRTTTRYDKHGDVAGEYVTQAKAPGAKAEIPAGHVVKGVSILRDGEGRTVQEWVKTREGHDPMLFAASLREAMIDMRGAAVLKAPAADRDADLLTVYVIPDLHLGMMAHAPECGEDYDLKIASAMVRRELHRLLAMAPPSKNAVVLFLGDFFHQNDQRNATPRSGHTLDVDGRWRKVYGVGARVAIAASTAVAERHEKVEVAFLPGNHDEDAALTLAVALELYFEGHGRVKVARGKGIHWFRRFGKCLLGASHGHTMKPDRMAMMLATDRPKDWGATEFRHFFFGHIHHETAKEVGPVRVESFTSPAAKDSYAAAGGYRSGRSLNAVTFHAKRGEVCRHRVNISGSGLH